LMLMWLNTKLSLEEPKSLGITTLFGVECSQTSRLTLRLQRISACWWLRCGRGSEWFVDVWGQIRPEHHRFHWQSSGVASFRSSISSSILCPDNEAGLFLCNLCERTY
jgi:hypothetical protein